MEGQYVIEWTVNGHSPYREEKVYPHNASAATAAWNQKQQAIQALTIAGLPQIEITWRLVRLDINR